jgi:hypothetical protein
MMRRICRAWSQWGKMNKEHVVKAMAVQARRRVTAFRNYLHCWRGAAGRAMTSRLIKVKYQQRLRCWAITELVQAAKKLAKAEAVKKEIEGRAKGKYLRTWRLGLRMCDLQWRRGEWGEGGEYLLLLACHNLTKTLRNWNMHCREEVLTRRIRERLARETVLAWKRYTAANVTKDKAMIKQFRKERVLDAWRAKVIIDIFNRQVLYRIVRAWDRCAFKLDTNRRLAYFCHYRRRTRTAFKGFLLYARHCKRKRARQEKITKVVTDFFNKSRLRAILRVMYIEAKTRKFRMQSHGVLPFLRWMIFTKEKIRCAKAAEKARELFDAAMRPVLFTEAMKVRANYLRHGPLHLRRGMRGGRKAMACTTITKSNEDH